MTASLFAGCGASKTATNTDASADKAVTLSVIHYLTEKPKIQALQNLADNFTKKNPDIKVKIESMSLDQYGNVLKMKLAAGDAPNIIFGSPKTYKDVVASGNILDLTNQEFVKRIDSKFTANVTVDNKVYGVPMDLMPSGVFYNKDIFKSAGVEVPTTWAEFVKVCETLKAKGITPVAAGYKDMASIGGGTYTEIYGNPLTKMPDFRQQVMEGTKKLADFPELKSFLQRFQTRNKYVNDDALQVGIDRAEQMFASGKTAMIVLGSWGIGAVRSYNPQGNFGIFMFPSADKAEDNMMSTGTDDTFMLSSHAENQPEALKFFDYMTSQEGASNWANDVQVLSAITGAKAQKLDPMAQDLADIYSTGKVTNWLAAQDFYGQYNDIWMKKLQEFAFAPANTNIDNFIKGMDEEFDKARTVK
jgi:raffinose/stachyose/melibiose transport system substrate-binding protein